MKKKRKRKVFTRKDWETLFPKEVQQADFMARIRPKVQEKIESQQEEQKIGEKIEKKVLAALEDLKNKRKIRDYFWSKKLSYADLIGIDFLFIYVDDVYRVCSFSVTGRNWIRKHMEKHPEIPVIAVRLNESKQSIQEKILALEKKI